MEDQMAGRIAQLGNSILGAARNELYLHMRFLDIALSSFAHEISTFRKLSGGKKRGRLPLRNAA